MDKMKKVVMVLMCLMLMCGAHQTFAEDDELHEGLYYVCDDDVKPMTELVNSGTKTSAGFKVSVNIVYPGKCAEISFTESMPTFYAVLGAHQSVRNYNMIKLKSSKNTRQLKWMSGGVFSGVSTNDDFIPLTTTQMEDNVYEIIGVR